MNFKCELFACMRAPDCKRQCDQCSYVKRDELCNVCIHCGSVSAQCVFRKFDNVTGKYIYPPYAVDKLNIYM